MNVENTPERKWEYTSDPQRKRREKVQQMRMYSKVKHGEIGNQRKRRKKEEKKRKQNKEKTKKEKKRKNPPAIKALLRPSFWP